MLWMKYSISIKKKSEYLCHELRKNNQEKLNTINWKRLQHTSYPRLSINLFIARSFLRPCWKLVQPRFGTGYTVKPVLANFIYQWLGKIIVRKVSGTGHYGECKSFPLKFLVGSFSDFYYLRPGIVVEKDNLASSIEPFLWDSLVHSVQLGYMQPLLTILLFQAFLSPYKTILVLPNANYGFFFWDENPT